jgi:hypothetical protein
MARPRREDKSISQLYRSYEDLPIWRVISKSVTELVNNGDSRETTAHPYIVGYICKSIVEAEKLGARS